MAEDCGVSWALFVNSTLCGPNCIFELSELFLLVNSHKEIVPERVLDLGFKRCLAIFDSNYSFSANKVSTSRCFYSNVIFILAIYESYFSR